MAKPRSDSLYARLTPEQREEVFYWLLVEGKSLEEVGGHLHDQGIQTSQQAISNLLSTRGLEWKLERAKETAETVNAMDLGDTKEAVKQGLRKRIFEMTFRDLSVKEAVLLDRLDLDRAKLALEESKLNLALDKFQWESASRVLKVVKEQPKLLRDLVQDGSLTEEQRIGRLIDALWNTPIKEGAATP